MSRSYGRMTSLEDAIRFIAALPVPQGDEATKMYVLHRLEYERDQATPVKPKVRQGRSFDEITCGNCGRGVTVNDHYCPGCGFLIDWRRRDP